ncbi:MAG TPA: hypothetical protein VK737_05060, partial [Opitutales bacterium]|nr:hypothetical protein [Opitutales bacterium]
MKICGQIWKIQRRGSWALGLVLVCALSMTNGWSQAIRPGQETSRFWTDLDNHRYDATIVSLYQDSLVTFRHPDGRTFTLAIDDLAPNDREAARDWLLLQPAGTGEDPPPTQTLSPYGRSFLIDEPRILRLRALKDHGYLSAYLGIPLTVRSTQNGALEYVNVYFFDEQHKRIPFYLPPRNEPIMVQDGKTTSFIKPGDFKAGQTYMVLIPIRDPSVRQAASSLVVAGNSFQAVATVFPNGSWRDFDFPERNLVMLDKYADYSGQELYPTKDANELFQFFSVARLQPATSDTTANPARDYFRYEIRVLQPFPASALSAQWYAFDKNHRLLHSEDTPPYSQPDRKDGMFILIQAGQGPAALTDAVTPTSGNNFDSVQLPGAAWWDKPEVDSIVFVFGTETKKI